MERLVIALNEIVNRPEPLKVEQVFPGFVASGGLEPARRGRGAWRA
jgi:hypothetical protein